MPFIIPATIAALSLVHATRTKIEAKKAANLYLTAYAEMQKMETAYDAQIEYLCHMLEERGIEMSEFDMIALSNPM